MRSLSPDLILSAHDHTAEYYIRERGSPTFERHEMARDGSSVDFIVSPNGPIIELQAPTCSYRMGVYNMGFGLVFIGSYFLTAVNYLEFSINIRLLLNNS